MQAGEFVITPLKPKDRSASPFKLALRGGFFYIKNEHERVALVRRERGARSSAISLRTLRSGRGQMAVRAG
jgi:hypothetical protein